MRKYTESAAVARARLANDPQRPQYHFTAPANWLNDPNGLIQWQGQYHLFYQHHPFSPEWGDIHWGHAVSDDLVHWSDLPIALTPDPAGADADGCWSGCLIDDAGVPTILYTGVRAGAERLCLATSDDACVTWRKFPGNPVIAAPPAGMETLGFRDPCVWREGASWRMILGSGIQGHGGAALLYTSPDLIHWTYLHPLLAANDATYGEMWECPGLFPFGERHLLIYSALPERRAYAFRGTYADQRFTPERRISLDAGDSFYGPQAFRDARGRLRMFGWLQETRPAQAMLAAGWAGAISAPRILAPLADGSPGMRVAPEWEALRREAITLSDITLPPDAAFDLPLMPGGCFEALVECAAESLSGGIEIHAAHTPDERYRIEWERSPERLALRGPDEENPGQALAASQCVAAPDDEPLRLQLLVDRSIIEVFVNERICGSWRVYPTDPLALQAQLTAGAAGLRALTIHQWRLSL